MTDLGLRYESNPQWLRDYIAAQHDPANITPWELTPRQQAIYDAWSDAVRRGEPLRVVWEGTSRV